MAARRTRSLSSGTDRAAAYVEGVLSGTIPACKWVRLACKRHRDDLARKRFAYHYDEAKANRAINFIENLQHVKGKTFSRKPLILSGWQCFVTACVFGWVDKYGNRRFRTVYIEVPRKNGKSSWSAGVALYMLTADGEDGAEVYSAATTREQAKIVWRDAQKMVERSPALRQALGVEASAHSIFVEEKASYFKALSRDQQGNLDGLNIHCAIIDELHGHKDRGIWDVIETATGARSQPLIWAITTSGSNRSGICYEQRSYLIKVLQGSATDHTYFGVIYTIDGEDKSKKTKADDWNDPASWQKANPNWGISVFPDDIARKARKAAQMASAQNNFLTKHLDVWVNADTAWMTMAAWDACGDANLDEADFAGQQCHAALDLASKIDIAAKIKVYPRDIGDPRGLHYYVFGKYYLPEDAAEDGRNSQYGGWVADGLIATTEGNVIDFDVIEEDLIEDAKQTRLIDVAYDPWQATQLANNMVKAGVPMVEYRQTVQNMSEPMKEVEALVMQGRLHYCADDAPLTWMISNVICHVDAKENIYPLKERPENKIDGAVALIMAMGRAIVPEDTSSIYEQRGLRTL